MASAFVKQDVKKVGMALVLLSALVSPAARSDYLSAKRKFEGIAQGQYRPGSRIVLSSAELNAYVAEELPKVAPTGIRAPQVELLGDNTARGTALVDFLQLRTAQGAPPPNWLLRQLLAGEHRVEVIARIESGGGMATVRPQRVLVDGIVVQGAALDWLIENYLMPRYPQAKIGRPFKLGARIEKIEVTRQAAAVIIKA